MWHDYLSWMFPFLSSSRLKLCAVGGGDATYQQFVINELLRIAPRPHPHPPTHPPTVEP